MFQTIRNIFFRISNKLGIEWAPLNIPISRRLQTLAATAWILVGLLGELLSIYCYIKLLYSDYWWLAILYGVWMLNDIEICNKGGRSTEWVRNWKWWRYYCDYFPIKLVKTVDLDPSKNYLFACYPHGILPAGAFGSFCTNAAGFPELFPGMTSHLIVLGGHFLVPFFRDLILAAGICSSSQESLLNLLDPERHQGNCAAVFVGGAAEAFHSRPGKYKIVLNRRKGFIRVAMKTGASLVPVFTFGETNVFRPIESPEGGLVRRFQEKVRQITGVSPIFPLGRGMFQYSFGTVPLRTPVTTVVGAPIEIKKNLDPTNEEVDVVHAEFTKRLVELFQTEKSKYLKNHEDVNLDII